MRSAPFPLLLSAASFFPHLSEFFCCGALLVASLTIVGASMPEQREQQERTSVELAATLSACCSLHMLVCSSVHSLPCCLCAHLSFCFPVEKSIFFCCCDSEIVAAEGGKRRRGSHSRPFVRGMSTTLPFVLRRLAVIGCRCRSPRCAEANHRRPGNSGPHLSTFATAHRTRGAARRSFPLAGRKARQQQQGDDGWREGRI